MIPHKIMFVFGTRPEAIKLCSVIRAFACRSDRFAVVNVVTAQHREMLDQVLDLFGITPHHDLQVMSHNQSLSSLTAQAINGIDRVLAEEQPDLVIVQGDTTSTFVAALTAFYHKIPVAHVEAGLRTFDRFHPFPEEVNRVMTSAIAELHFAPTEGARRNLLSERVPAERIHVTGNTVIDALLDAAGRDFSFTGKLSRIFSNSGTRKLLLTTHRRENQGAPMAASCRAIGELVRTIDDIEVVFPVHLSPAVRKIVFPLLEGVPRIHLVEPLDYLTFIHAMKHSYLIVTDSGGIQEEAPSLSVPVLVLRETTERPEAVDAGVAQLVGSDFKRIVCHATRILTDPVAYAAMARPANPYGDGRASKRILRTVEKFFSTRGTR